MRTCNISYLFVDIFGDFFDDSKLKPQTPYERPLFPPLVKNEAASYVLQEKMFSLSGEDFRVRDLEGNEVITIDVRASHRHAPKPARSPLFH